MTDSILLKTKEYLNRELESAKDLLERKPDWLTNEAELLDDTIHRCLSAAILAQLLGVAFEDINPHYDAVREELEEMRSNR